MIIKTKKGIYMQDLRDNCVILDEETVETTMVTKTQLYGSKKSSRLKKLKRVAKQEENLIYKASKAAKNLNKEKFKKILHIFRTSKGQDKLSAAKMIIKSASKHAA